MVQGRHGLRHVDADVELGNAIRLLRGLLHDLHRYVVRPHVPGGEKLMNVESDTAAESGTNEFDRRRCAIASSASACLIGDDDVTADGRLKSKSLFVPNDYGSAC